MKLREAAQQALEALKSSTPKPRNQDDDYAEKGWKEHYAAITALRAALAEPVLEPVAWMVYTPDGKSVCVTDNPADFTERHRALPLYTAPPQRKPLTDEDIAALVEQYTEKLQGGGELWHFDLFARAIERAHGIGEGE